MNCALNWYFEKSRNKTVCAGYTGRTLFVFSLLFSLLTLCSASVSGLQFVFSNSSYKSTAKWESCQIFKADILLGRVELENL